MDLALSNLQRLICHKNQQTNEPTNHFKTIRLYVMVTELIIVAVTNITPFKNVRFDFKSRKIYSMT